MLPAGCEELCPGCRYRALTPAESAAKKHAWAARWLGEQTLPLREPAQRLGYRRKTLLHAERGPGGWRLGLLKRKGWDAELVPIPDCPAHAPAVNRILGALRSALPTEIPLAFVQVSGPLLTLVLKCKPSQEWRAWGRGAEPELRAAGALGLQLNWNPSAGRKVMSARHQELVFGERFVREEGLLHGALSFRQQIPQLEGHALRTARDFLRQHQAPRILDLYSGAGASLALWEAEGWRAAGVELAGEAVEAARLNAPLSLVLKGKAEQRLPQLEEFLAAGPGDPFSVYTNPPREGMAPEVTAWLAARAPVAVAYLSCNPRTLARDLELLGPAYRLASSQPYDFFPGTDHVEALALLERRLPGA